MSSAVLLCHPQIIREGELEGTGVGGLGPVSGGNTRSHIVNWHCREGKSSKVLLLKLVPRVNNA